jgi:hypothetical protein
MLTFSHIGEVKEEEEGAGVGWEEIDENNDAVMVMVL